MADPTDFGMRPRDERAADILSEMRVSGIATKDPGVVFLAEFLGGLIGLLGLGYFYVGLIKIGLIRLLLFWVFSALIWSMFLLFVKLTLGAGLCLAPVPLVLHVGAIYLSASDLRKTLVATQQELRNRDKRPMA